MSHHNSQRPLLLPRDAYDAHNAAADHCKIFAKSLALDAECLAASKNYDAARAWSLLGSRAQNILKALCAAGEAPAVSTTEPAASRPRSACGLATFPEDILGAIIAFVDLPMRFTCVAACSTLRDACARLSPRLEHSLLAKRFPLINTFGSASALEQHEQFVQAIDAQLGESDTAAALTALPNCFAPAPRDLFRTFKDFEGGNAFAVRPETSVALVAYTLSLEIKARKMESKGPGEGWRYTGTEDTIYVGTGRFRSGPPDGDGDITYIFTVPEAALESAVQLPESDVERWSFFATVVASRRGASGKLQYAKLYHLHCNLRQIEHLGFDVMEIPPVAANQALNYIKWRADDSDMYTDPVLELLYNAVSGSVEATFKWNTPNDIVDMTLHEARACLEHYAAWSE